MRPDPLARERTCIEVLRELEGAELVLIGGYAVSTFGPARESVDIDLVLPSRAVPAVRTVLERREFLQEERRIGTDAFAGRVERWTLGTAPLPVGADLLIDGVSDRVSGVTHSFEGLRGHAHTRTVSNRDRSLTASVPVADAEALIGLKLPVGRLVDLRDVAVLAAEPLRIDVVDEFLKSCPRDILVRNVGKLRSALSAQNFRDSLKGVYRLDERTFERYARAAKALCEHLEARFPLDPA